MRHRDVQLNFRLSHEEANVFNGLVKKSKLARESYLRQLLKGLVHMNAPSTEFWDMKREIFAIGNNLDQITNMASTLKLPNFEYYRELNTRISRLTLEISEVDLPIKCKAILPPDRKVKKSRKRGG